MTTTTFLHEHEQNIPLENQELQGYLEEIRLATKKNWQLLERKHTTRGGLFSRAVSTKSYELYVEVGGVAPFQQLTCVQTEREVYAYFFGMLSGLTRTRQR